MNEDLERDLKRHTKVIKASFSKRKLEVLQYSYKSVQENGNKDADCNVFIEIASIGKKDVKLEEQMELSCFEDSAESGNADKEDATERWIDEDVEVVVNIYDELGEIILSESEYLLAFKYEGYDTVKILLSLDGQTLKLAKSAKIFCR